MYRSLIAAIAILSIAVLFAGPASGDGPTGSFTAIDNIWTETGQTDSAVNIDPGGTVSFAYPSGGSVHNADFDTLQPTSCVQTAGTNSGSVPPLPAVPTGPGWTGSCTFAAEGIYKFHCDLHTSMQGAVVVGNPPEQPPGGGTGGGSTNSLDALKLRRSQRGTKVRGSVPVAIVGSDLVIELKSNRKRVARVAKANLPAGTKRFTVALNRKGRSALKRAGKLKIAAKVTLTAPGGAKVTATKTVRLKK